MLLRMFSDVFWPNRGSLASRPSVAAASSSGSESMPSTSWICRILATPSPAMASISTRPGGICSRSSSSMPARPVLTSSAAIWSVAGPTPLAAAREPSSSPCRRSPVKPAMARAAVRKARMRNGFSPLSSRKAAICSSTSRHGLLVHEVLQGLHQPPPLPTSAARPWVRQPSSSSSSSPDDGAQPGGRPAGQRGAKSAEPSSRASRSARGAGRLHGAEARPGRAAGRRCPSTRRSPPGRAEHEAPVQRLGRLVLDRPRPRSSARETARSRRGTSSARPPSGGAAAEQLLAPRRGRPGWCTAPAAQVR